MMDAENYSWSRNGDVLRLDRGDQTVVASHCSLFMARRIAACLKACAGIPTEVLESNRQVAVIANADEPPVGFTKISVLARLAHQPVAS